MTTDHGGHKSAWMRDGHTARVVLDVDRLSIRRVCPNTGNYEGLPMEAVPDCRRHYDECGQPDPSETPLRYCNYDEWAAACGSPLDLIDIEVTRGGEWPVNGEFPIGWRWDGDTYLWAPSALIDAASQGAAS